MKEKGRLMSLISLLKQHEDENLEYAVGDIITERHKFHIEMTDEKNYVEIKMKTDNQKDIKKLSETIDGCKFGLIVLIVGQILCLIGVILKALRN